MEAATRADFEPLTPDPVPAPERPAAVQKPAPAPRSMPLPLDDLELALDEEDLNAASSAQSVPTAPSAPTAPAAPSAPAEPLVGLELELEPDPPSVAPAERSQPTGLAEPSATLASAAAAPSAPTPAAPVSAAPVVSAAPAPAALKRPASPKAVASPSAVRAAPVPAATKPSAKPQAPKPATLPVAPKTSAPSAAPKASIAPTAAKAAAPPVAPVAASPSIDRDSIARNQIIERYLSGKLPIKGATEFERFCKENPELLDELGLPERVHAGLRLLEAAGKPEPWEEKPKRFWEHPALSLGLGAVVLVLLISTAMLAHTNSQRAQRIATLGKQVSDQPLEPATTTRTIRLLPSRSGASSAAAVVIGGGGQTQLADMKLDMSHSPYREFRVTIDRLDQGRVMIINNLTKDSNGHLRIALNSSALGPGTYQMTIEGLTWRGDPEPDSWITIGIAH